MKKVINANTATSFKDFLDKSTNLITIFGILNALFIYSTTISDKDILPFLAPTFYLLSMLVWLELILFALECNDGSLKYKAFYYLIATIEIGLGYYFIRQFKLLLVELASLGLFFLCILLYGYLMIVILKPIIRRLTDKQFKIYQFIMIILATILGGITMMFINPLIHPWIEMIVTK
ncbi:MAG: hypothetical protein K9G42_12100 [Pedobacter sp.]|nr:hypothetical protein [Pedobacter sp.]